MVHFMTASAQESVDVSFASDAFSLPGVAYSELDTEDKLIWRAWSPHNRPLPPPSVNQTQCVWARPSFGGHMCLMDNDRISQHIRKKGYWVGCDRYVEMWHTHHQKENNLKGRTGGQHFDIIVEVGANIGACTLQLLLQTNATILAFEPSPLNLFHLTETLHKTTLGNPLLASRVTIFPIAVGDSNKSDRIFVAKGNAGNSVIHETVRDHASQDMSLSYPIEVRTLDYVLSAHAFLKSYSISVMKVDAQGFECRVLSGLSRIAVAGMISTLSIELANGWLSPQGCSAQQALEQMRTLGFQLNPHWQSVPQCIRTYFGCDVVASWGRASDAPCTWKRGGGGHPEAIATCS